MEKQTRLVAAGWALRAIVTFGTLGTLFVGAGCGRSADANDGTASKTSALTAAQIRILGFEATTTDWSSPTGVLASSTTRSQGSFSASVRNNGWTEVISRTISSLGPVGPMLTYDVRLPATVPWGETRLIVRLPSKQIFWQELGSVPLTNLPAGVFHKITFALPPALSAALSSTYSDLELRVVINAPNSTTGYLLDNIVFAPGSGGGTPPPGSAISFSVTTPTGIGPADMFMSTTGRLQVDDQVVLGTPSALEKLANFGSAGFENGALAFAHADVYNAAGPTFLRSQSTVRGFVRAAGIIQTQPPVTVQGGQQPNTPTTSAVTSWSVTPPATVQPFIFLDVDQPPANQPPMPIAPGAYAGIDVHSRSRIALRAGTYFFDSFNTEPQAQVFLDTSQGSIFIYTKTMFRYHGGFVQSAGPEGKVLVGHAGTSNVDLQVGFVGTVVAPNAQIDLRRPTTGQHKGSFFGARIECFSNSTILRIPFDWSFVCPRGDSDGDGVSDCDDACPANAAKTQPGTCGCAVADTDSDGDGLLNCQDCAPTDPANVACADDDDPPPPRDDPPLHPTVPGVNQATCQSAAVFGPPIEIPLDPADVTPAQEAQLLAAANAMVVDTTLTNPAACEQTQDPADCSLDVNNTFDGPCIAGDIKGLDREDLDAACVQAHGPGYICRMGRPTALCLNNPTPPPECQTRHLHCGLPDPDCAAPEGTPTGPCTNPNGCPCSIPNNPACGCAQFELCSDPGFTATSDPTLPDAYTPTNVTQTPPAIAANVQPAPDPVYTDPPNDLNCPRLRSGDCWCTLGLSQPPDMNDTRAKPATHGGGSIVELQSEPDVNFHIDPNPLAFGESNFIAGANAAYKASIIVRLPLIGEESQDLVDLGAGVEAGRCRFSTLPTRFFVLGLDFIDFNDKEPFDTSSDADPALQAAASACSSAVGAYMLAVDQSKRALKDAQTLIEAYRALPPNTSFVKVEDPPPPFPEQPNGFCQVAGTSLDSGFPPGDCAAQPIAATLNRYVDYYNDIKIPGVNTAMQNLALTSAGLVSALQTFDADSAINFLQVNRNDSVTVVNAQFFIGPIPVNITVDVGAFYGVTGDIFYRFNPSSALELTAGGAPTQVAAIGGQLVPSVGARLEIFAGVGFDIPGFAIKAGISGDLTLVEVGANLDAGVGLSVATQNDTRPIPTTLAAISTGELFFPTRQYEFFIDWFYGASVEIPKILEGTINAKLKLKALFFSKTFKKMILRFGPAFSLPKIVLIQGGGTFGNIEIPAPGVPANSLGTFEMQTPLPRLQRVSVPGADPSTLVAMPDLPTQLHFVGNCDGVPPR